MLLSCEVAGPNARNARGESPSGASSTPKSASGAGAASAGGFRESLKRLNSGDFIYDPQVGSSPVQVKVEQVEQNGELEETLGF